LNERDLKSAKELLLRFTAAAPTVHSMSPGTRNPSGSQTVLTFKTPSGHYFDWRGLCRPRAISGIGRCSGRGGDNGVEKKSLNVLRLADCKGSRNLHHFFSEVPVSLFGARLSTIPIWVLFQSRNLGQIEDGRRIDEFGRGFDMPLYRHRYPQNLLRSTLHT